MNPCIELCYLKYGKQYEPKCDNECDYAKEARYRKVLEELTIFDDEAPSSCRSCLLREYNFRDQNHFYQCFYLSKKFNKDVDVTGCSGHRHSDCPFKVVREVKKIDTEADNAEL